MTTLRESNAVKKNIIIVGDFGTGKTSLLHRFIKKEFMKTSINSNLDFYSHEMKYKDDILPVFIWDSLGHERFQSMTDSFYKKADGVILVFDLTDDKNVSVVDNWIKTIIDKCTEEIPIIIVGNKKDICSIHERKIKEVSDSVCRSHNVIKCITASARNGDNVDEIFKKIIISVFEKLLNNTNPEFSEKKQIFIKEDNSDKCCLIV